MKPLILFINEGKDLKSAKFKGITGAVLYKTLIESIQHEWEKCIKQDIDWQIDTYQNKIKDVSGDSINSKASAIIAEYATLWEEKENGDFEYNGKKYDFAIKDKWIDGKDGQRILNSKAIDFVTKMFKDTWDDTVITGSRSSRKERWGTFHELSFDFGNGYSLSTNVQFGSMKPLLKYATEKNY